MNAFYDATVGMPRLAAPPPPPPPASGQRPQPLLAVYTARMHESVAGYEDACQLVRRIYDAYLERDGVVYVADRKSETDQRLVRARRARAFHRDRAQMYATVITALKAS
jgi:molybdopterin-guanine dinucleotide biosynthesis protein A